MAQSWVVLINALENSTGAIAAGTTLNTSKTLTAISPGALVRGEAALLPANFLKVGSILRFTAHGWFGVAAAGSALTLGVYAVQPGEAITAAEPKSSPLLKSLLKTEAAAKAKQPWRIEATAVCTKVGAKGSFKFGGIIYGIVGAKQTETAAWNASAFPVGESEGGVSGEVPTGEERQIVLGALWGTESVENTITCNQFLVEALV